MSNFQIFLNKEELKKELSEIMIKINNFIGKFISLPNKTILSTIIILGNIYDLYKSTISKYIFPIDLIFIKKYMKGFLHKKIDENLFGSIFVLR